MQSHCTAVPVVREGDLLASLFCSLPRNACDVRERVLECSAELRGRGEYCGRVFSCLSKGQTVVVRWVAEAPPKIAADKRARKRWGRDHVRWVHAVVVSIDHTNGYVWVRDESRNEWALSRGQVENTVVMSS